MTDQEYVATIAKLKKEIAETQAIIASQPQSRAVDNSWWSVSNAMTMSASVLLFGCLLCLIGAVLLRQGLSADSVLKTFGTILIVTAALFLVVAGYSDRQIAPVMGLLGTIAGYILGKNTSSTNT